MPTLIMFFLLLKNIEKMINSNWYFKDEQTGKAVIQWLPNVPTVRLENVSQNFGQLFKFISQVKR